MRIFLIRHGFSEGNENVENYALRGDPHIRLTDTGWKQAVAAGAFMKQYLARDPMHGQAPLRIWSSTYRRTRETAAGLIHGSDGALDTKEFRVTSRLIEMDFGLFTECSSEEDRRKKMPLEAEFYEKARERSKFYARPPGGESPMDVQHRVSPFIGTLYRDSEVKGVEDVVIVTHGVTLRVLAMSILNIDPDHYDDFRNPNNCSIFVIEGKQGAYSFRQIWNGEKMKEVNIDLGAKLKGVYLPDVPKTILPPSGPRPR